MIRNRTAAILLATCLPLLSAQAEVSDNPWYIEGREAVAQSKVNATVPERARNVILFIGDGMGLSTITAARILEGQLRNKRGEENYLAFERFPFLALTKTYNTNQQIPDSAGTVTALVTGVKTKAGVLGVDEAVVRGNASSVAQSRVPTLFEQASERGLGTGVVTTTRVTHATPAGAYAHSPERNWEDDTSLSEAAREAGFPDIAKQLVAFPAEGGSGLDVVLGGGRRSFLPAAPPAGGTKGKRQDNLNLIAQWQAGNPKRTYVSDREELLALEPEEGRQVLGLFSDSNMRFEVDRVSAGSVEPSLAEMTGFAIDLLATNPSGYVLLVEGGRIDHAHHANNAHRALFDTLALGDAVEVAARRTDPKQTLILVTADHGHPVSLRGYPTRGNPILGHVVENNEHGEPDLEDAVDQQGRPFTSISYAAGPGFAAQAGGRAETTTSRAHDTKPTDAAANTDSAEKKADPKHPNYLQEATRPFAYGTHSGEDIPVYARGPGANLFRGVVEQNFVYHAITEALGWNEPEAEPETEPEAEAPAP